VEQPKLTPDNLQAWTKAPNSLTWSGTKDEGCSSTWGPGKRVLFPSGS